MYCFNIQQAVHNLSNTSIPMQIYQVQNSNISDVISKRLNKYFSKLPKFTELYY